MFSIKHIALYMFIFDSLDLVEIRFWHMAAIYIYIYTNSVKACLLESGDRLANVKALYTQSRPELELYSLFAINKTDVYNLYVRFIRSRYRSG